MMENETQNQKPVAVQEEKPQNWRRNYKKIAAVAVIVFVAFLLMGTATETYVQYVARQNGPENTLMVGLKNTLAFNQLTFHSEMNKQEQTASPFTQKLIVDGAYKRGSGLSATVSSTTGSMGTNLVQKSRWVVDASNNTYINLQSYSAEITDDSTIENTPAMDQMMTKIINNNNNKLKDAWTKYSGDQNLKNTGAFTGFQGCMIKAIYNTQADSRAFQDLISQVASGFDIRKSGTSSSEDTYIAVPATSQYSQVGKVYTGSKLYKWLVGCSQDDYSLAANSAGSVLKGLSFTIGVNNAKKYISSLSIKSKGAFDMTVTLSPASDVTISVPKESTPVLTQSDLTLDMVKQQYPHDYKHLLEAAEATKSGVCSNLQAYEHLVAPSVVEACKKAK